MKNNLFVSMEENCVEKVVGDGTQRVWAQKKN